MNSEKWWPTPQVDEGEPFLERRDNRVLRFSQACRLRIAVWGLEAAFFLLSLYLLILSQTSQPTSCANQHSVWSPALEAVEEPYTTVQFNGTFRSPSPYKGPPGLEVDDAWNSITDVGVMSISQETLDRIDHSPESVRLPPESGGGFMGSLEVFHQIHCVNLLWQGTHEEYYRNHSISWGDSPQTLREHIDHCADLLRQKLQCDSDVGIYTYNWVKNRIRPYPNFNTRHKCRNFEGVLDWAIKHQAPKPYSGQVERMKGFVEMELPP